MPSILNEGRWTRRRLPAYPSKSGGVAARTTLEMLRLGFGRVSNFAIGRTRPPRGCARHFQHLIDGYGRRYKRAIIDPGGGCPLPVDANHFDEAVLDAQITSSPEDSVRTKLSALQPTSEGHLGWCMIVAQADLARMPAGEAGRRKTLSHMRRIRQALVVRYRTILRAHLASYGHRLGC
jgi:hypothetical protein